MAEAQAYITVVDDSIGGVTVSSAIPLIVIATKANKLVGDSATVTYPGTSEPLTLRLIAGQQDLIDKYGNPYFEINNGTVNQASELNELGLWTAYSYLGVSNLAYILRAEIDTAQLAFSTFEPTSPAKNGTYWLDLNASSFGIFRANGLSNKAKAWNKVDVLTPTANNVVTADNDEVVPMSSYGTLGNIAIVTVKPDGSLNVDANYGNSIYEKVDGSTWAKIGSKDWYEAKPTIITGATLAGGFGGATVAGEIIIQEHYDDSVLSQITVVEGDMLEDLATKINDALGAQTYNVVAEVIGNEQDGKAIQITQPEGKDIVIWAYASGVIDEEVLKQFGLTPETEIPDTDKKMIKSEGVKVFISDHIHYPSGTAANSIWMKTTKPNYGAEWVIKRYNSTLAVWNQVSANLYSTELEAEQALGNNFIGGALFVKVPAVESSYVLPQFDTLEEKIMKLPDTNGYTTPVVCQDASQEISSFEDLTGDITVTIKTVRSSEIVSYTTVIPSGSTVDDAVLAINNLAIDGLIAEVYGTNNFKLISDYAYTTVIKLATETVTIESVYTKWEELTDYKASLVEPTSPALDTTMWINQDYAVDILVNDGDEWKGLNNNQVYITSADPIMENSVIDGDIWLDPSDSENYPLLKRYDSANQEWETIDLTDQSTPAGIIFADARENAGPAYANSTHKPFSTSAEDLRKSQYVDPDAPDPRSYPAGMLLFNTRFSTNNVKMYFNDYFADVEEDEFTIGNSPVFPFPGTDNNPKVSRWVNASGNELDGKPYMGRKAQRIMIVRAMASAIMSSQAIRGDDVEFGLLAAPGYVELYDELVTLNVDRKEKAYLVIDTPARLKPDATAITDWVNNRANAASNGDEGLTTRYTYSCMTYPWGLGTSLEGYEVMIPSSAMKLRTIAYSDSVGGRYKPAAGKRRGIVTNATNVGFLNDEGEFEPVKMLEGVRDVLFDNGINPIYNRKNGGLVVWGDKTMQSYESMLDQEHVARLVCQLRTDLDKLCEPYYFEINDDDLRKQFGNAVAGYLSEVMNQKGLEDFAVVCDESNNTRERRNRKQLWCDIAILPFTSVRWIYIPIRVVQDSSQL